MASVLNKIKEFLRSPQGRKLTEQLKQAAKDPKNQQRLRDAMRKLRKR